MSKWKSNNIRHHYSSFHKGFSRSHLINIYGILLKIDAVVKSFNGPLVLLDHHQHNLAALPTKIPHDRESSVSGRFWFWDGFQCQPKVPMIQRATRCIRVTPVCTNMSHLWRSFYEGNGSCWSLMTLKSLNIWLDGNSPVLPLLLKLGDIPTSPTRSKVNRSSYDCMRESENADIGKVWECFIA